MQVGSLLRYSEGTSVKENLVNLAGYSSPIGGSALAQGASRVFSSDPTRVNCSKKCSKHLHAQTTKEEHHEAQTVEFCTPCSSVFTGGCPQIISAKPLFIGSIPIAASNHLNNLGTLIVLVQSSL
jgi:hypothetical protein